MSLCHTLGLCEQDGNHSDMSLLQSPIPQWKFSGMSYCFSITFYYFFVNTVGKSHCFQNTLMLVRTLLRLTMSQDSGLLPSFSSIELCSFFFLLKELAFIGLFSFGLTYIIHFIVYIYSSKRIHRVPCKLTS